MHPEDIKAALRKNGHTQTSVAAELGVATPTVCCVIYGSTKSERIAQRISELIGKDLAVIWPGRYERIVKRINSAA